MSENLQAMAAEALKAPASLGKLRRAALIALAVGLAGCAVGSLVPDTPQPFFQSYLVAYLFWLSIALGALALSMLQHMTGGAWGLVARRINEAAGGTLVVMAVLFVPILLGLGHVYGWVNPEPDDRIIAAKSWWLNPDEFLLRAIAYFAVWLLLWGLNYAFSGRQDRSGDPAAQIARMRQVSGPGLVVFALVTSFASFDWLMSLDAHWYSSLYGLYFLISSAIAGMAFLVLVARWLARHEPLDKVFIPGGHGGNRFHDYGKLLLAFTLVWAYFAVSQFLITWSGNLPEEVLWYLHRQSHGWQVISLLLVFLHFVVPFLMLLSADRKKNPDRLARVAVLLLAVHWLDYFWQAGPNFHENLDLSGLWIDAAAMLAVGGLWLLAFSFLLGRRPVVPFNDPHLPEALHHE